VKELPKFDHFTKRNLKKESKCGMFLEDVVLSLFLTVIGS